MAYPFPISCLQSTQMVRDVLFFFSGSLSGNLLIEDAPKRPMLSSILSMLTLLFLGLLLAVRQMLQLQVSML